MPRKNKANRTGIPLPLLRWRGFTLQMFLFLVLPLSLLLLVVVFISQSLHHQEMRGLVGDRDLRAVRASANSLSHEIASRSTALEALAFQVQNGLPSPGFLDQAARNYGFDGGLALFDAQGRLEGQSSGAAPEVLSLGQIQRAGPIPVVPAGNGGKVSTARLAPPVRAADGRWLVLGLARPEGGSYALAAAFTPASLARETLGGIATAQATVLLLSQQGDLLYQYGEYHHSEPILQHPGIADVLRGESGVNYSPPEGGSGMPGMDMGSTGEHVVAFSPVPPFNWGLVMEEPWEASAGPLLSATQSAPLVLVPLLLLALLALWFGARQVIQPLQALERRAGRLATGDFSAIREPVGGISEIHNLQDELVDMSAALQAAQDALHGYIGALTAGVENERRALARELHDDTLQALIALNQRAQMVLLRTEDPAQRRQVQELQAQVTGTIASLRRAIGGLRPIYLEDLGLSAALGMLAREIAASSGLEVSFSQEGPERRLPPETELAFYRIAQEALNNAAHHAGAGSARLSLSFRPEGACLSIVDDGRGFTVPQDPNAFARLGHYGLLGMRERADLAGAALKIDSRPGQGTRVEADYREESG